MHLQGSWDFVGFLITITPGMFLSKVSRMVCVSILLKIGNLSQNNEVIVVPINILGQGASASAHSFFHFGT